jgi:hypothetical protein
LHSHPIANCWRLHLLTRRSGSGIVNVTVKISYFTPLD